jgi:hypothetical protein
VAVCDVDYLRRFAHPDLVGLLPGGLETGSDLRAAFRELDRRGDRRPVRIYSGGYHLPRALLLCRFLGREVEVCAAEGVVRARSRRHAAVVDRILTPVLLRRMTERERRIRAILRVDTLPLIGRVQLGMRGVEALAVLREAVRPRG